MITSRLIQYKVALGALIIALGFTACHQSVIPSEAELVGSCEVPVRITARVSPFGGVPTGTRADVPGTVDNEQIGPWKPLEKGTAVQGESRISRLYVFVTKRGSDKIEKTLYYYAADYKGDGGEEVENDLLKGTEIPAMELTTTAGEVTMDMTLLPGDYTFLLVANSHQLAETIKSKQPSTLSALKNIVEESGIGFASIAMDDEGFIDFDYDFSIIGYGDLTVPATTDPDDPVELLPVILMERHYARVDVSLTTATNKQRTDYLSVDGNGDRFDPSQYRLTQFLFLVTVGRNKNEWKAYPVRLLPVEGEYTALPEGVPRYPFESYKDKVPVIGDGEGLIGPRNPQFLYFDLVYSDSSSGSELWGNYINNGKTGGLRKLWKQPLVFSRGTLYQPNKPGPGYIYLPSVYFGKVSDPNKVVRLQLKFSKLDGSETLTYRIPIHNEEGASDYYSIRRNTIYDIDLTFYGNELQVQRSGIKVLPWKVEDQTIVVDIDDESGDDQDGVIDGHGEGTLSTDPH